MGVFEAASATRCIKVQKITRTRVDLFHSLSPDDSFVIGFRVAQGAGSLNQGAIETELIEKGLYSLRLGFSILKKKKSLS